MESTPEVALVGQVVGGRYLVETLIADGGLVSVYLALDHRLDRRVAMNVLPENLAADEVFSTRFAQEAKAAARLSHPNIVPMLDQGSDGSVHYWTMEHLPGRTLREVLTQRRTMTVRETVEVLTPVLDGLAAAHRIGIVHGDLKPENVFLTDDGRIKVADFGLARAITASISRSGGWPDSRPYQAPESVDADVADPLTDVYALGILLVELLTGQPSIPAIKDAPPADPLAPTSPTGLAGLPVAFDQLVRRATAHDRDQRPADAAAFKSELRAAARQLPAEQQDLRAARPAQPGSAQTEELPTVSAVLVPPPQPGSADSPAAPARANGPQPTLVLAAPGRWGLDAASRQSRHRGFDDSPEPTGSAALRRRGPVVAGALVLVLIVTGVWWFVAGPGSSVETPSVTGLQLTDAQAALSEQGLANQVKQFVYDDKAKVGVVLSTDPVGGAPAKKKSTVLLTVSKGPQTFPVPTVTGKTVAAATEAIQAAHLKLGTTTTQYSPEVTVGRVISTSPQAKTELTAGKTVDLIVSGSGVIRGLNSGRCVGVPSGSQNNGTQTVLQDCNNSPSQLWTQTAAGELTTYGGAKCLDVSGANKNDGATVQIWDCAGVPNQKWKVNPDGTIVGVDSGKCLDATGHGTGNGTPIQMWTCTGGDNQKWSRG